MKRFYLFLLLIILTSVQAFSQEKPLADNYFRIGEYEKALEIYQSLQKRSPANYNLFMDVVKSYQELERFEEAQEFIENQRKRDKSPRVLVELAQNAILQGKSEKAKIYMDSIRVNVREKPMYTITASRALETYALLDWAEEIYLIGLEETPDNASYIQRLALIYGEQGKIHKMFQTFVELVEAQDRYYNMVLQYFSRYITDDPKADTNKALKRILLTNIQQQPDILYYDLLSWLFIQEQDYAKAFQQERAILNRDSERGMQAIRNIGVLSFEEKQYDLTREIANYLIENLNEEEVQGIFDAEHLLLQVDIQTAETNDYPQVVSKFEELISKYKRANNVALLEMDYAKFLAYKLDKKPEAIEKLRKLSRENLALRIEASVRLALGDILVTDNKFNQALIQFTQVQRKMEGHELAHEANFKIAQTSYFKGDFKWALTQLDVLKRATTQLISNDALFLSLRIVDNLMDDTTHVSLKDFARADLLELQGKTDEAIQQLEEVLVTHEGFSIIDDAHFRLGELYYNKGNYEQAEIHWKVVTEEYGYDLLADAAYYRLGLLYQEKLDKDEEAMACFEKIIFDFSDSIYYVDARKRFRNLRGDFKT